LGIYLLWTFYRVSCISTDPKSFYRKAMAAMNDLCQPQPEPQDGEILQLEPYVAAAVAESELSIPADNPLQVLCDEIFEKRKNFYSVRQGGNLRCGRSQYAVLGKIEFNDDVVKRILRCRLNDGDDVKDAYGNARDIFGVNLDHYDAESAAFNIAAGALGKTWNAFVVKLVQFINWKKSLAEVERYRKARNSHISDKLSVTFKFHPEAITFACVLGKKITGAFLKALDSATNKPPLRDFFAAIELARREDFIFQSVLFLSSQSLEMLAKNLPESTAATSQERLELAKRKEVQVEDIKEIGEYLALQLRDGGTPPNKEEEVNIAGALNELLGSLDATVRKLIGETTFDFVMEDEGHGNPKQMGAMTMVQYFDTLAKQWDEEPSGEGKETNGALLQRAETDSRERSEELRKAFLQPMDEEQVKAYLAAQPIA
jgi:hypothetical protein